MGTEGIEPSRLAAHDPKSCSSASSDTSPDVYACAVPASIKLLCATYERRNYTAGTRECGRLVVILDALQRMQAARLARYKARKITPLDFQNFLLKRIAHLRKLIQGGFVVSWELVFALDQDNKPLRVLFRQLVKSMGAFYSQPLHCLFASIEAVHSHPSL